MKPKTKNPRKRPKNPFPRPITKNQWERMTPEKRMVCIAKDVVYRIKIGAFHAVSGLYLSNDWRLESLTRGDAPLRTCLRATECYGCAKGAVYLSRLVTVANGVGTREVISEYGSVRFSWEVRERIDPELPDQDILEDAFEGSWDEQYPDPEKRLLAIMRNVIRNKGRFKIEEVVPPKRR